MQLFGLFKDLGRCFFHIRLFPQYLFQIILVDISLIERDKGLHIGQFLIIAPFVNEHRRNPMMPLIARHAEGQHFVI